MKLYIKPHIRVEEIYTECLLGGSKLRCIGEYSDKDAMGKENNIFGNHDEQNGTPPVSYNPWED